MAKCNKGRSTLLGATLALVITVALGPSALADGSSLPYSHGGLIGWDAIIAQYNRTGELFRIEGHCHSSCTFLLAIRNVCVDPSATLYFHAAIHRPDQPVDPARNNAYAHRYYKASLASFILANHYMDSWTFHPISGHEIIQRFGYRQCPGR